VVQVEERIVLILVIARSVFWRIVAEAVGEGATCLALDRDQVLQLLSRGACLPRWKRHGTCGTPLVDFGKQFIAFGQQFLYVPCGRHAEATLALVSCDAVLDYHVLVQAAGAGQRRDVSREFLPMSTCDAPREAGLD